MSEKRFEVDVDHLLLVWDTEKNKRLEIEDIVALLNEQQSKIEKLNEEVKKMKKTERSWRNMKMSKKPFNFTSFTDDEVRLLVCIAVSERGLTDEEWQFMRKLEKELFNDE